MKYTPPSAPDACSGCVCSQAEYISMLVREHDYHISEITFASPGQGLSAQRAHHSQAFRGLFPFPKALSLSLTDAIKSAPAGGAAGGVSHGPWKHACLRTPRSSEMLPDTALIPPVSPTAAIPDPPTPRAASPGAALPKEKRGVSPSVGRRKAPEAANATKGGCAHLIWDARMPPL